MQEKGTETVIKLLEQLEDTRKLVSSLAALEIRSAIRRRERSKDIPSTEANAALQLLDDELRRLVEQPLTSRVVEMARRCLDLHPLRALDAIQLASCLVVRDHLMDEPLTFVTSDKTLLKSAASEGLRILNPEVI